MSQESLIGGYFDATVISNGMEGCTNTTRTFYVRTSLHGDFDLPDFTLHRPNIGTSGQTLFRSLRVSLVFKFCGSRFNNSG